MLILLISAIDPLIWLLDNRIFTIIASIVGLALAIVFVLLYPVLHYNDRGTRLLESIRTVGLYDIENRAAGTNQYLPEKFFKKSKTEIFILAITAYTTLHEYADVFEKLVNEKGVRIKIIILYPDKKLIKQLEKHDPKKMVNEIYKTIKVIRVSDLQEPGFEIRFMKSIPPYTGVLIDGDVEPISNEPKDSMAELRIQPSSIYENQHAGVIIHLHKTDPRTRGVFEYFAGDLRSAWERCEQHPELFDDE